METRTSRSRWLLGVLIVLATTAVPARGTTFVRLGLEELTAGSSTIVLGEVVGSHSYWSPDSSMILTDVRVAPTRVLKGEAESFPVVVTVLGGTVGDITTLIVGGAALEPGRSYVLFLGEADLHGAERVRTVREQAQGVFEVRATGAGLRAVSQASEHHVLPGPGGDTEPPGGRAGLAVEEIVRRIETLANRAGRR